MFCRDAHEAEVAYQSSVDGTEGIWPERIGPSKPCEHLRPDQTFAIIGGDIGGNGAKQITNIAHNNTAYMPYLAGPVEKVGETREPIDDTCSANAQGFGGEVDRLVAEKDGTLKLKRFMVTSKCVNGRMQSTTKRLN